MLKYFSVLFFFGQLSAQNITLVNKRTISYTPGMDIINVIPEKGILQFNKLDKNLFNTVFYDFNLKQEFSKTNTLEISRKLDFMNSFYDNEGLKIYFNRKKYTGFVPKTWVDEIIIDTKTKKTKLNHYKFKNFVEITGVNRINNKNVFTGFEMYKPWGVKRVLKFVPFFYGFPLFFPAGPHSRPFLAEFKDGNVNYIDRDKYKSKEYKNLGIHDILVKENEVYLGMTNGVIRGKSPIKIVKTNPQMKVLKTSQYNLDANTRISSFKFNNNISSDTISFSTTTGGKLIGGFIPGIKSKKTGKKDPTQNLTGTIINDKLAVGKNKNKFKDEGSNEIYKTMSNISYSSYKIRKVVDKKDLEVSISEKITPIYETQVVYVADSKGRMQRTTQQVLVGYTFTDLTVNIHNYTNNSYKVLKVDNQFKSETTKGKNKDNTPLKFYHYVGVGEQYSLKHASINFKNDTFFLSYLQGLNNTLTTCFIENNMITEFSSLKLDETIEEVKKKEEKESKTTKKSSKSKTNNNKASISNVVKIYSKVSLQPISDTDFLIIKLVPTPKTKIKGAKKEDRFKELSVYSFN